MTFLNKQVQSEKKINFSVFICVYQNSLFKHVSFLGYGLSVLKL